MKSIESRVPRREEGEVRALIEFRNLSAFGEELRAFAVTDDGADPHLKVGEFAIVDASDRELQHGELYLIQFDGGTRQLVQVRKDLLNITGPGAEDSLVWWVGDLRGYRELPQIKGSVRLFTGLSDGPYQSAHLKSKMMGRVVGYATKPHGRLIKPRGKPSFGDALFNPPEYVETLTAAGYQLLVVREDDGDHFWEAFPADHRHVRLHAAATELQRKAFAQHPDALALLMMECERRGLILDRRAA